MVKHVVDTIQGVFARANPIPEFEVTKTPKNFEILDSTMFVKKTKVFEKINVSPQSRQDKYNESKTDSFQKILKLKKHDYKELKMIDIKNSLSRDYYYAKWDLIELMELEEKQLKQLTNLHQFKDVINRRYQQQLHKDIKINLELEEISYYDILQELNLNKHTNASNLVDVFKQNVINQINDFIKEDKIEEFERENEQEKKSVEKNEEVSNVDTHTSVEIQPMRVKSRRPE